MSSQKRFLIAMVLAMVFFVAYDSFYLSKFRQADANKTAQTTQTTKQGVANANSTHAAPVSKNQTNLNQSLIKHEPSKPLVEVNLKFAKASIDEFGRINSYVLTEQKYKDDDGKEINLVNENPNGAPLPLEVRFENAELNNLIFSTPYSASKTVVDATNGEDSIILTQNLGEIQIQKTISFKPDGSYKMDIKLNKATNYFVSPGSRPSVVVDGYTVHGVLLRNSEDKIKTFEDGAVKSNENLSNINIAAVSDRYYTALFYDLNNNLNVVVTSQDKISQIFAKGSGDMSLTGYIGPKEYDKLNAIDSKLTDVIEYGWFTFIAKPMFKFLKWLHSYIGNWGWAIVVMTLVVRMFLAYPTYRGMLSMNKLKDLAPKLKELQEKYKDNPTKMQTEIMGLYRKHGANPLGGCLPILLQIPIFFAIYRVLLNAIELKGAPWIFWVQDLAIKDPYFILPLTMGALMYLQQKITPTNFSDPMQEKIMRLLPLIFTVFFIYFPAGLTLYWTINNICSLTQQYIVNKIFEKQKREAKLEHENRSR